MPASAVEHESGMGARGDRAGDLGEMGVHRRGVDEGQHQAGGGAVGRADRAEELGPLVAGVARRARPGFLETFSAYNEAIWPAQIAAYGLGAIAIVLLFRPRPSSGRVILGILAGMWVWTGIAYHMVFFSAINPAGYVFGGVFVLQGALPSWFAFLGRASFGLGSDFAGWLGIGMIAYALLLYPMIGALAGQSYPAVPASASRRARW